MKLMGSALVGMLALTAMAAAPASNTPWTPWRAAEGVANAKGIPIAYYFMTSMPISTAST